MTISHSMCSDMGSIHLWDHRQVYISNAYMMVVTLNLYIMGMLYVTLSAEICVSVCVCEKVYFLNILPDMRHVGVS